MDSTLQNSVLVAGNTASTTRTVIYWIMTVLVAFPIGSGGIVQMMQYFGSPHSVVPVLGYPMYFFLILGFWKFFGALTILVPRFPRLKEWAYAGFFFDLTGAAATRAFVGDGAADILAPLVFLTLVLASWALRPTTHLAIRLS